MARIKLEINKQEFQKVVTDLETAATFINSSALWKAVEQTEWAKNLQPRALTAAVAYVRAKELGIVCITKPGKKGNPLVGTGPRIRIPRSTKMRKFAESFRQMRKEIPVRFIPLVDKAEKGSKMACIKLKCLECSAWQPCEIRQCVLTNCALFPIRPFQKKTEEVEETNEL